MNHRYFVDDNILASLLNYSTPLWQMAYTHYRRFFENYFGQAHGIEPAKCRKIFQEAFALLVQGLREGVIATPLGDTLFTYLVQIGQEKLRSEGALIATSIIPQKANLAGEVLVLLIREGHEAAFSELARHYPELLCAILKNRYYFITESPREIIGESLMIMKVNIEKGKLGIPLKARLFTYTYNIARNKFLEFNNMMEKGRPIENEEELNRALEQVTEENDIRPYVNYMIDLWPALSSWLEDKDAAFEQLIARLDDDSREILRLRFEEGLKHREIGKRLNIREGTARKRLKASLKKWRKIFFETHVLKDADASIHNYLHLHLVESWPFSQIAASNGLEEEEIKTMVEDYLDRWREKYRI